MTTRFYFFRVLTAGWIALIFLLSSQPNLHAHNLFWESDKLVHVLFYGVLSILLAYSFMLLEVTTWKRVLLLTIIVTVFGVADEYLQSFFPGRYSSEWDVLADGTGGLIVASVMRWRQHRLVKIA